MLEIFRLPLKDVLREWADFDVACYALGRDLGMSPGPAGFDEFQGFKHVFWTNNMLGSALHVALMALVDEGLAEWRAEQFRWVDGVPPDAADVGQRRRVTLLRERSDGEQGSRPGGE